MATGRFISQREARDGTLNNLPLAHILAFDRAVIFSDDWGRYSGDPAIWKMQLFPRQDYVTDRLLLAIQHDLAQAGMIGFYAVDDVDCCLVYRFLRYQTIRTSHRQDPKWPTPPEAMWWMWLHPQDTRKEYDCPDIPWQKYQKVVSKTDTRKEIWLPREPRPEIHFEISNILPFGGVVIPGGKLPEKQVKQVPLPSQPVVLEHKFETQTTMWVDGPMSGLPPTELEKDLAMRMLRVRGMKDHWHDQTGFLKLRELAADFPDVDLKRVITAWTDNKVKVGVFKKSKPWQELRNYMVEAERQRRGGRRKAPAAPPYLHRKSGERQL